MQVSELTPKRFDTGKEVGPSDHQNGLHGTSFAAAKIMML
jgi:hypothetical protein